MPHSQNCKVPQKIRLYKFVTPNSFKISYHIAGKFGRGKVWRFYSFRAFGERKFGEIDKPIDY